MLHKGEIFQPLKYQIHEFDKVPLLSHTSVIVRHQILRHTQHHQDYCGNSFLTKNFVIMHATINFPHHIVSIHFLNHTTCDCYEKQIDHSHHEFFQSHERVHQLEIMWHNAACFPHHRVVQ